jgi:hypothetical protein
MAIVHQAYTVGTTPTLIAEIPAGNPNTAVLVFNDDNNSIFLGDNTVSVSNANIGLKVARSTTSFQIWLNGGDKLYAVSASGTAANTVVTVYSKVIG